MIETIILFVLLALVIIYAAYATIRQLRILEGYQARRIFDLMIIGTILYLLDFFMPQERGGQTIILRTAGILIFLYGYRILLLDKYLEGRKEARS